MRQRADGQVVDPNGLDNHLHQLLQSQRRSQPTGIGRDVDHRLFIDQSIHEFIRWVRKKLFDMRTKHEHITVNKMN